MTFTAGILDGGTGTVWSTLTVFQGRIRAMAAAASTASAAWPNNNDAYLIPFQVAVPTTFIGGYYVAGTSPGTGNFDVGIYGDDFARIVSTGAVASVNTTDLIQGAAFTTPVTLQRGRYFMAVSAAATTVTGRGLAPANQTARALGVVKMATAYPLPTTVTPASMGTATFVPVILLTTLASAVL